MALEGIAKTLIGVGIFVALIGLVLLGAAKMNIPLGKLPGDLSIQRGRTSFFFPIVTCLLLSFVLTFVLWVIQAVRK